MKAKILVFSLAAALCACGFNKPKRADYMRTPDAPARAKIEGIQRANEPFRHDAIVYDIPSERHPFHFTQDFSGAKVHGSGRYRYRLVLQQPYSREPESRKPYAVSHPEADFSFVKNEKKVFQGTTDKAGRTDVFAFEQPVDPDKWQLRLRTGSGPYGEQFVLKNQNGQAIPGFVYEILVCAAKPYVYKGMVNEDGLTAYAATPKNGIDLQLYQGGDAPRTPQAMREACRKKQSK